MEYFVKWPKALQLVRPMAGQWVLPLWKTEGSMIERLKNWLSGGTSPSPAEAPLSATNVRTRPKSSSVKARPKPQPEAPLEFEANLSGTIESHGPGKNVFVRKRYIREDTGTHESLKIVDDSLQADDNDAGIDPYNTGKFDRSQNWDMRFRK